MPFFQWESAYDSLAFESRSFLRQGRQQLRAINALDAHYRALSTEALQQEARSWTTLDLEDSDQITRLYALGREVCARVLGKRHYDVQILGALAALGRRMVQMSTGSGKTLTLILPTLAYGLTHKGVMVLTVNDYLSHRDWQETKPVYDFFGLTNAYVATGAEAKVQHQGFACDITYCTNSTLGFAYLNAALASGIGQDIKPLDRPLHAAIIDEADEILMDDARNPLIIAAASPKEPLAPVVHQGKTYLPSEILQKLRLLTYLDRDEDDPRRPVIGDQTWEEIMTLLGVDDSLFSNDAFLSVIYQCIEALYHQKCYEDYVVSPTPDADSGSRILLIDKATGRLAHGRTLNDDLHAYVEMKEGVYTGEGTHSVLQITYQVLFNLFPHLTGVTGTVGKCFQEFMEIYGAEAVAIPDRFLSRLKQQTHLFVTRQKSIEFLARSLRFYQAARHPVLVGAASDVEAEMISEALTQEGLPHTLLVSTDTNEEGVIAKAGEVGSVVVTTDIMGRGTDIHVEETDYERGLVVFQVGGRPNSRVERQFAGRAARQGEPGRYHRLLALPELESLGVKETTRQKILACYRQAKPYLAQAHGDILLDGAAPFYTKVVGWLDDALYAEESVGSQSRIEDFKTSQLMDFIQVALVKRMDRYRQVIRQELEQPNANHRAALVQALVEASLSEKDQKDPEKRKLCLALWEAQPRQVQLETLYQHTTHTMNTVLPALREYSESALKTTQLAQMAKRNLPPEDLMSELMKQELARTEKDRLIALPQSRKEVTP